MSDIKRYGVWDKPPREDLVTYADHEAAIEELQQMRRTLHANHEYKDARIAELEAEREQVLADAKARIEEIDWDRSLPELVYSQEQEEAFRLAKRAALAALDFPSGGDEQAQTEGEAGLPPGDLVSADEETLTLSRADANWLAAGLIDAKALLGPRHLEALDHLRTALKDGGHDE